MHPKIKYYKHGMHAERIRKYLMHPKSRNVVNGMTFMKKTMIRKLIYVLTCLFLLCNFFCLSNGEQSASNAFSYDDRPSITINVPNGAQMEIKNEKSASTDVTYAATKTSQIKTISNVRFILLTFFLLIAGCLYSLRNSNISISELIYSRTFIIKFIHDKDGPKRR